MSVSTDDKKWSDREFVLEAVRWNGYVLKYASEDLRADRDVVLEAVRQHGHALEYASDELRADREVVLDAVRKNGLALWDASDELRADREVVLEAIRQELDAWNYADPDLLSDQKFLSEAGELREHLYVEPDHSCPIIWWSEDEEAQTLKLHGFVICEDNLVYKEDEKHPFTGSFQFSYEKYPDQIALQGEYFEGKRHGVWIQYWCHTGLVKQQVTYKYGELNGSFVRYNEDGYQYTRGNFKRDIADGVWVECNCDVGQCTYLVYEEGKVVADMQVPDMDRYMSYKVAMARIKDSYEHGFYLETVTIAESVISDRLISSISYMTGKDRESVAKKQNSFSSYISLFKRTIGANTIIDEEIKDEALELCKRVDTWRKHRNEVIHGIVSPAKGTQKASIDEFKILAEQTAGEGKVLVGKVKTVTGRINNLLRR